jgi:hypothetical protein
MTPMTTVMENLASQSMFLLLEFDRFGNSRKADVEANTTANQDRFAHSKRLLDSPELAEISKQDGALRVWLDQPGRCWKQGKSLRFVLLHRADEVYERCIEYQSITRPALVQKFLEVYIAQIAESQKDLGPQFDASQYPSLEEVKKEFDMTFQLVTFNTPDVLKVASPKVYAAEKEKASQVLMSAAEELKSGMRALFQECVARLLDALSPTEGKKKKLHKSAVEKLQNFLTAFNLDNVNNDSELQVEVEKLKLIMTGVDVDKIKESDNLKADLVAKFAEVSTNMTNLVTVKGRKIR